MLTAMDTENQTRPPGGTPPPGPRPPLGGLTRASDDVVISGLCGGLGRQFGIDPLVFRIAFVVMALAGGTGILLYLVGWALVPDDHGETFGARWLPGSDRGHKLLAAGLAGIGLLLLIDQIFDGHGDDVPLGLVLVGLGAAVLWSRREGRTPTPPAPPAPPPGGWRGTGPPPPPAPPAAPLAGDEASTEVSDPTTPPPAGSSASASASTSTSADSTFETSQPPPDRRLLGASGLLGPAGVLGQVPQAPQAAEAAETPVGAGGRHAVPPGHPGRRSDLRRHRRGDGPGPGSVPGRGRDDRWRLAGTGPRTDPRRPPAERRPLRGLADRRALQGRGGGAALRARLGGGGAVARTGWWRASC